MKRKWLASVSMTALLVGGVLTGCSTDNGGEGNATSGDSDEKTTVTLAGWGGNPTEQDLLEQTQQNLKKRTEY
jgi:multiple sugar transport system substrate-binding protein